MKSKPLRGLKMLKALVHDLNVLKERSEALKARAPMFKTAESLKERDFVRMFGTKVRKVRYSNRPDFVGLLVIGDSTGFLIVKDPKAGERKARLIDVNDDGSLRLTPRYLTLRSDNSLTHLWRGLLAYVQ